MVRYIIETHISLYIISHGDDENDVEDFDDESYVDFDGENDDGVDGEDDDDSIYKYNTNINSKQK